MEFDELLSQVLELLQREKRVSYRVLKRRFHLDDEYLEDVKDELIYAKKLAVDEDNRVLVWTGEDDAIPQPTSQPGQTAVPETSETQTTQVASPPAATHTPDAERRQLTVMFIDIVESTALSGELDPEDYREVVRAYQAACTDVIQRYDGYVAQLLGDGLLVYFGYPQAHEDDAQRAIHTGLGILKAIETLNNALMQARHIELSVRLGIHTGLVVVGEMGGEGRQEQLALGETPNVAARLQGLAESNTLMVSEATYKLVQGYFACETLGEHDLKGVTEPMRVHRVLQPSGVRHRLDITNARGLTPLVGREQEVGVLIERWAQCCEGHGQVILLSGEAGIGKSRLVQVLKDHVAEGPHTRLECRSSPYYQNTVLYPIVELLQRILNWQQDDAPDQKLGKLEQALGHYRLPLDESVPLFADLLSLPLPEDRYPSLHLTPQRQRQKTLETIVAMLVELAEKQPALFVVEDLHWTDPSTLEFLGLLIKRTPASRLYALFTCRPEFETLFATHSNLTQMTLNRLSQDDVEQIVHRITDGKPMPGDVLQQLVEKTDGVPLFIEEMTKSVLESGFLKERDDRYEVVDAVSSLSIPSTLQDSLMARLDHLVTAKGVAQLAAVIGRQFAYELLQAISQLDAPTLQRELRKLIDAELIYQHGLSPHATYMFKHALIQDTAYESLLRSTRQQYHQRIAQTLEERFPETIEAQPELLAHHYTEAGQIKQSIGYWQQAGQRASKRSAYTEAISHLTTGLTLLQSLPETLERHQQELPLQSALGAASLMIKGHVAPEVESAYTRAHLLCQHLGDTQDVSLVLFGLWRFYMVRADFPRSRQLGEELLRLAEERDGTPLYVVAHYMLGFTGLCVGELHSALNHFEVVRARYTPSQRSSPLYWAGQDPRVACRPFGAFALWPLGYPDQALARAQEGLVLATELGHSFTYTFALLALSMVYQLRREGQPVYDYTETALALSTEQGFSYWLPMSVFFQGWALMSLGKREAGLQEMRQGLTDWRAPGGDLYIPYAITLLAEGYGNLKQAKAGCDIVNEGLEIVARTGENWCEAELHRLQGQLLLQQSSDNATEAESCFQQAISIAQKQSAKSWELRAAMSLARLWQSQGKRAEARELLGEIYGWFTEGFDTADLIDAKTLLDELT